MTTATFQYTVHVVPTIYSGCGDGDASMRTNQYTVTTRKIPAGDAVVKDAKSIHDHEAHNAPISSLPGVFFIYDMSPFVVHTTEQYVPRIDFLARLCSIIGGAYALLGLLDSLLYKYAQKATSLYSRSK